LVDQVGDLLVYVTPTALGLPAECRDEGHFVHVAAGENIQVRDLELLDTRAICFDG
jgi:hypothetical protein